MTEERIYIVVSQTGTMLSRILKLATGAKYNHASVSYDGSLKTMYSFGRLNPYNPFWGGFVRESTEYGTFKRFRDTEALVIALPVDPKLYKEFRRDILKMYARKRFYHYNYLGLFAASVGIPVELRNHFYCSEFVRYILKRHNIINPRKFRKTNGIIKPIDFLQVKGAEIVYRGKLRDFMRRPAALKMATV